MSIKRYDLIDLRHSAKFLVIGCKFSRDNDLINEERLLYLFYDDWLTVGKILKLLARFDVLVFILSTLGIFTLHVCTDSVLFSLESL